MPAGTVESLWATFWATTVFGQPLYFVLLLTIVLGAVASLVADTASVVAGHVDDADQFLQRGRDKKRDEELEAAAKKHD